VQKLFKKIKFLPRLQQCFTHLRKRSVVGFHRVFQILVVSLMIGYRRIRDISRIKEDPMILRLTGMRRMPDVSTITRHMKRCDARSIRRVHQLNRRQVLNRLADERLRRVTSDFDGSVLSTGKKAEGSAVGFNKKKKGARSYYPLFCTIGQTGQVLDVYQRPGNVHDSNGALEFMKRRFDAGRRVLGNDIILESRQDAAFFSDKTVDFLAEEGVQFTISVPFERFVELKGRIERMRKWKRISSTEWYAELDWVPNCWQNRYRFIAVRQRVRKLYKEPIQLNLFIPYEEGFDFKVIVTNRCEHAKRILGFHNGRGTQEKVFAELKDQCQMDYVPVKYQTGNQMYQLAAIIAHNLFREMQMMTEKRNRNENGEGKALWKFKEARTIRLNLLQRAGRLTRPQGKLHLTLSANAQTRKEISQMMRAFDKAA
jgi:hypothetical protein